MNNRNSQGKVYFYNLAVYDKTQIIAILLPPRISIFERITKHRLHVLLSEKNCVKIVNITSTIHSTQNFGHVDITSVALVIETNAKLALAYDVKFRPFVPGL